MFLLKSRVNLWLFGDVYILWVVFWSLKNYWITWESTWHFVICCRWFCDYFLGFIAMKIIRSYESPVGGCGGKMGFSLFQELPCSKLTYPTNRKGNSFSQLPLDGIWGYVSSRVDEKIGVINRKIFQYPATRAERNMCQGGAPALKVLVGEIWEINIIILYIYVYLKLGKP